MTIGEARCGDLLNLGIWTVPKAGLAGVELGVAEPVLCAGGPLCVTSFAALLLLELKETLLVLL